MLGHSARNLACWRMSEELWLAKTQLKRIYMAGVTDRHPKSREHSIYSTNDMETREWTTVSPSAQKGTKGAGR